MPRKAVLILLFASTILLIVIVGLALDRPSSTEIGRSVGKAIGASLLGIAAVLYGRWKRRSAAGYLVGGAIVNCVVASALVAGAYTDLRAEIEGGCRTSLGMTAIEQEKIEHYCACAAAETTPMAMTTMVSTYLSGSTDQDALKMMNERRDTQGLRACQGSLKPPAAS